MPAGHASTGSLECGALRIGFGRGVKQRAKVLRDRDMLLPRYAVDAEPIRDHLLSGGSLEADVESDTEDPSDGDFPPGSIRA